MAPRVKKHYVNNPDFYAALVNYREKLKENPNTIVPDYIGICLMKICEKLSTKPNFIGYTYRDEMIADAIENCIASVNGFNPDKSENPFSYFTMIAWNAFLRRIAKEKKQQYIKHKNMQNMSGEFDGMHYGDMGGQIQQKNNELSDEIIRSFERVKDTPLKKLAAKGLELFVEEDHTNDEHKLSTTNSC